MTLIEQEFILKKYQEKRIDLLKIQDSWFNSKEENEIIKKELEEVTQLCRELQTAFDKNIEKACKEMIKK